MENLSESLKNELTILTKLASSETGVKLFFKEEEPRIISSRIYELMKFIEDLFEQHRLVHQFDYRISSDSISESLQGKKQYEQYRKENYILPFLHHLQFRRML